jgi:hypothetical protein
MPSPGFGAGVREIWVSFLWSIPQGIRLEVPAAPAVLCTHPSLLSRLLAQANVLIVAGRASCDLAPAEADAVCELAAGMQATLLVLCSADSTPPDLSRGWPTRLGNGPVPPLFLCPTAPVPRLPVDLALSPGGLRLALSGYQQARRLETTLGLFEERLAEEVRHQETRRKALQRRGADLGGRQREQTARAATEAIRRDLEVRLARLETALTERLRERVLPTAPSSNKLNNLIEDLSADDMTEEAAGRMMQMGVRPDTLRSAVRLLEDMVHDDCQADLRDMRKGLLEAAETIGARLTEVSSALGRPRPPALDEALVWDALRKMTQLDFQYQREAQRRGILDLLGQGRRPVIIATMTLSMFGAAFGVGTSFRLLIAPLMLLLFLGSLAWAWHEFRQERRDQVERELRRLREALGTQLKRLYEQVLREWQGRLTRHLREADRDLARQADDELRAWTQEQTRIAERERQEIQEKQKVLEQRLRELGSMQQQVQRLRQAAVEARLGLGRAVEEILRNKR